MTKSTVNPATLPFLLFVGIGMQIAIAQDDDEMSIETHPGGHVFHIAESAPIYERGRMISQFMLTAEQSEGRFSIVRESFEPGFDSYPRIHSHHWHTEVFIILAGRMQRTVNGETKVMGPGSMVYIPPKSTHATRVIGDETAEAIMIYTPAGYEKNYFRRSALTEEQLQDENLVLQMMELADVVPADEIEDNRELQVRSNHVFYEAGTSNVYGRETMLSEFMLTAEQSDGMFSIVKETFKPGFDSYRFAHKHEWHSEVFCVLSGQMQWTVNGETRVLGPGDMVYIPPNSPHATKVLGDEEVHSIMVYEPAGYELNYLRRNALTPEERQNPEVMREHRELSDTVPIEMEP